MDEPQHKESKTEPEVAVAEVVPPAAVQPGALQPNQLFGKYRVLADLGAGGMAQVFLAAIDGPEGFEKRCVVKRILPQYAKDPTFAQMFVVEARVAAMMTHPNIVHVFEFSKVGDEYFLAMEYVSGPSLHRLLRTAKRANLALGPQVAVEIGIAMAHALHSAHTFVSPDGQPLNIVHRDVSPDNILISVDGVVKLTDFGVVKSTMSVQNTVAGMVKGKWSYMSPEQVTDSPVDHRSDLFSLGIVLYETALLRRLFRGESLAATVNAVSRAQVPPPSSLVPGFPPELERILLKALQRDPAQRFQSGAELAAALESFRAGQPWTSSGTKHLASLVATLFPKDSSPPRPGVAPGSADFVSRASTVGETAADLDEPAVDFSVAEAQPKISPLVVIGLGAAAVLGSMLFWYFAIS